MKPGAARLIFAIGVAGTLPWIGYRVIRELWVSAGAQDYLRHIFMPPVAAWIDMPWWWISQHSWPDNLLLPSILLLALSQFWSQTGGRLARWIAG